MPSEALLTAIRLLELHPVLADGNIWPCDECGKTSVAYGMAESPIEMDALVFYCEEHLR